MLSSLTIQNVVLIDHLFIEFGRGLCALTGETGAGKSILLDSMGLALGARSESGLVRKGAESASVSAEFDLGLSHPVFSFLSEQGFEPHNPLVLRRSVAVDGKSRAYINDHPVSVSLLKQVGEQLVEIHGQFDTQALLNAKYHRSIVDEYAGIEKERADLQALWNTWQMAQADLIERRSMIERARAEELYLQAALEQLEDLNPKDGEEESLSTLRTKLMRKEQTMDNFALAMKGSEDALAALNTTWRALEKAGEGQSEMASALDRAMAEIQEVLSAVQSQANDLEDNSYNLSDIDDRLFALKAQARKHACTIDDLPSKRDELRALLSSIQGGSDDMAALEKNIKAHRDAYIVLAKTLSEKRTQAGIKLDRLMAKELVPLKLEKARFETNITPLDEQDWGVDGIDRVQFLVATNPGAAAGPLHKIASGGEMSRFMLALKVVLAEVGIPQTLVFDEVDSGIGGATADAVGDRLQALAKKRQILVVTHSPQVAAKSAYHAIVVKTGKTNPTTKIIALKTDDERREEIARMLSGSTITNEARAQAANLLSKKAA